MEEKFGYHQDLKNGYGIVRAKTTGQLRSWDIPRTMRALEVLKREWGNIEFPGLYILFDSKTKKVYVGEAKDISNRLKNHFNTPEDKIKGWERVFVLNDGRAAMQSDFNDTVIRKSLELYLINLFKANKYTVVSQGEQQKHNPMQKSLYNSLKEELDFLLLKKNFIIKLIEESGQEEILKDDLRRLIEKRGWKIEKWVAYEAIIDGKKTYIRPGSPKPKNRPKHWQITFRDKFKDTLQKGNGYLLVPRDGVLFIPFKVIQKAITDDSKYKQNTIDIWISFKDDRIELRYSTNTIDVTEYKIVK
jgi:predicted GIY-YIG superfamily endonuclease